MWSGLAQQLLDGRPTPEATRNSNSCFAAFSLSAGNRRESKVCIPKSTGRTSYSQTAPIYSVAHIDSSQMQGSDASENICSSIVCAGDINISSVISEWTTVGTDGISPTTEIIENSSLQTPIVSAENVFTNPGLHCIREENATEATIDNYESEIYIPISTDHTSYFQTAPKYFVAQSDYSQMEGFGHVGGGIIYAGDFNFLRNLSERTTVDLPSSDNNDVISAESVVTNLGLHGVREENAMDTSVENDESKVYIPVSADHTSYFQTAPKYSVAQSDYSQMEGFGHVGGGVIYAGDINLLLNLSERTSVDLPTSYNNDGIWPTEEFIDNSNMQIPIISAESVFTNPGLHGIKEENAMEIDGMYQS
ncbi:hypothetical protein CDAR_228181 [Caerostris darwini]|uniref:Uncharacterized protein n=1 Tax=Caerostris darwini TaxID=1538125 RepID=A0AAV4N5K0_9ARAC|nr:hypothetical protein CDAR_228181 [Caerostris darwini]